MVEEALIEMYLAGISVRRVEDITEGCGKLSRYEHRVRPQQENLRQDRGLAEPTQWKSEHPYLYLDGIVMKRTWAGEVRNVSLLVASAVHSKGFREFWASGRCQGGRVRLVGVPMPPGRSSALACSSSFPMPAAA